MDRILYLDPWSGASGDMILASLVDAAGADLDAEQVLRRVVAGLGIPGVEVVAESAREGGFSCRRVTVNAPASQPARRLADLVALLDGADLSVDVRRRAGDALRRLAEVEARLHGVSVEEVHLHELGGVDTLVDVTGCFALYEALDIGSAFHAPLPLGGGWVDTDHGPVPVPAPATLALLEGREVCGGPVDGELTTPTGALLITETALSVSRMPAMVVERVGYGAGRRSLPGRPNLLRAVVGHAAPAAEATEAEDATAGGDAGEDVVVLQAVVDDATPELLAHAGRLLLAAGAVDVWSTPIVMKKGRLAVEVTVLAKPADESSLVELLFSESTTFGVRRALVGRHVVQRDFVSVMVGGHLVPVKVGRRGGRVVTISPEYEAAAKTAADTGRPLKEIMTEAAAAAGRLLAPQEVQKRG
jgi:pyridinium-3,5-bisthiocarboxylic acid mononucleotide nickel chelatase